MNLPVLAVVNFASPLLWAVLIGWILTVVIHEFSHGLVAYLGGDYTIKERGGLSLNPLQYVDPLISIVLPVVFMVMGGVPLPGGVTFVRNDLLRNRLWITAVSLAGPLSNFLIMLGLLALFHPRLNLFHMDRPIAEWSTAQVFVGALALLQGISVVLNLIPCPPLDGFNAIAPYLPEAWVERVRMPPLNILCLVAFFLLIARHPAIGDVVFKMTGFLSSLMGLSPNTNYYLYHTMQAALYDQ